MAVGKGEDQIVVEGEEDDGDVGQAGVVNSRLSRSSASTCPGSQRLGNDVGQQRQPAICSSSNEREERR